MIDLLMSGDLLVDSPPAVDRMVQLLVQRLGLPEQRSSWGHDAPGTNYTAMFARVSPSLATAPTTIEVLAPRDVSVRGDPIVDAWHAQRTRPVRTHATVVASRSFDEVKAHVRSSGVRHRLFAPDEHLPFGRLWLGVTDGDAAYDPAADGGLRIEVVPYEVLRIPGPPPEAPRPDGSLVRMLARTFFVDDVAATLDRLHRAIGWVGAAVVDGPHGPAATLQPLDGRSAALELVHPTRPGPLLDFYERHGPGPYAVRIGAHGLGATLADLDRRGTPYRLDEGVATVDPAALGGAVVELADAR